MPPGLRINEYFGNFFQRNVTDIEFGVLDADKAVAAQIKHEGKLDEGTDSYFQCAVLYTSSDGERRVRVHNIAVPSSSVLANAFRHADMDTTIAFVAKQCTSIAAAAAFMPAHLPANSRVADCLEASARDPRFPDRHVRQDVVRLPQELRFVHLARSGASPTCMLLCRPY